ncbi:MAG: thiamine pyrophosphate-binding protein [Rhodospirillales bacterium]|nr:thiamine pyrophosphate-binding protein [Rhodospirillales bacterium]MDH3909990.1 thiamine pyrophosphate-binding protein [Rhodospirillales bacterium]MDH3965498.1 thiamine pyrophosphate-binding protein [Rhodospirillales bacterium]
MTAAASRSWPEEIFAALAAQGVRQVAYVPDAGHKELIERCAGAAEMETVALTTEEEGIALLAGAWLGGQRGALLMQSSGVGNCVNMLSLMRTCAFPLLMLVTMRGQRGEFNPWQLPMGETAAPVLELGGCRVFALDDSAEAGATVAAAGRAAFDGPTPAAVLIAQRVVGMKTFGGPGDD